MAGSITKSRKIRRRTARHQQRQRLRRSERMLHNQLITAAQLSLSSVLQLAALVIECGDWALPDNDWLERVLIWLA